MPYMPKSRTGDLLLCCWSLLLLLLLLLVLASDIWTASEAAN